VNIEIYLKEKALLINNALDKYLPKKDDYPSVIHEAMRYSAMSGGKRLRPVLLLASTCAVGGDEEKALPFACAVELIHAYSLIHDDLPAMDDSDYRRGKLSSHKVFGEAFAVLAGDALLTYAFNLMSRKTDNLKPEIQLSLISEISHAIGSFGLLGGQVVDIQSENKSVDLPVVEYIHTHKTGFLIRTAVKSGAIIGGGSPEELSALVRFADKIGLAFQIIDDILDESGDSKLTGKPVGGDKEANKSTYPAIYGIKASKERAECLIKSAVELLDSFGEKGRFLQEIAFYMLERNR